MAYTKFVSDEALQVASDTRDRINGVYVERSQPDGFDIISVTDALDIDEEFMSIAYKPNEWTLLHRFIKSYLIAEWYYAYRKFDDEFAPYAESVLNQHNVTLVKSANENREYDWYLFEQLKNISGRVAHEAFCILFDDRELMRAFSLLSSKYICETLKSDYPRYLEKNGQIKRYSNWNQWLRNALIHRENGRCAICKSDLTGAISLGKKIHIDHIVPISRGGTNDPTNLQVLCEACNLSKGNRNTDTGVLRHVPWDLNG
ncbi:HNH endonuclease signature motif containing protein [Vibrio vulnificus]|uniref:HNH endonuclease n=1 Tax=Vibrio vulnificus TaxID=672 RepID=UPI002878377F|nr:HNH endonuclease signature motif containing protein [Vibrio vulnificus]MDS1774062.1 HNH endonuclease signature motif containing protein [Vibrio vulnificus]MDS1855216.1 HNH endonuclease signature motif containing protein [Vibrio vulnificus]